MTILNIFSLCGGLGLFLYGMSMMSNGLEVAAGDRLQMILEKLTANRFIGVLVGALITALIQSSSATTVMVVGFVNSSLMTLSQAVWIIMGANIGTTITGQMIALDIGALAPLIAFIGVLVLTFFKKKNITCWGEIIAGLGILFIGMSMMSDAMVPLRDEPYFIGLMTSFNHPLIGILVGAIFTAIIQSSSASIGILQALAKSGLIPLQSAAFVLFGQNIGTCITALLASLNGNRNAKRTTLIHLLFNLTGTIVFVCLCLTTPIISIIGSFSPNRIDGQIANLHTIFNLSTTLLLLPFGNQLAILATKILPIKENENKPAPSLVFINETSIGSTALAFNSIKQELARMFSLTKENVHLCHQMLLHKDFSLKEKIDDNENYIDYLNKEISTFISKIASNQMAEQEGYLCRSFFKIANDLERMGDIAYHNAYASLQFENQDISFQELEHRNILELETLIEESLSLLQNPKFFQDDVYSSTIFKHEQMINQLQEAYKLSEIHLLVEKKCNASTCIQYSEILLNLERLHDYIMNIQAECIDTLYNFT